MCGITAVFNELEEKENFVKKSLEKIKHRGSSHFEYEIFNYAALGTNRLPIVGEDTGKQPVSDKNEEIFAVLNGEIYNHKKLRKDLEKKGYKFKTNSDTEVLIYLYKEYGNNLIEYIDSEIFAFIIYDKKNNKFFAARDRFGLKPLYYAKNKKGTFFFASELKQLSQFDYIEKIYNFPKGHFMTNGNLKKYFELNVSSEIKDEKKAISKISSLLENAVKKRVQTKLPLAVLLSGGVDSSLIMELATKYHNNVTAYILGTKNSQDYKAAIKLCKEKKYNYKIVKPHSKYSENIEELIKSLETYEAQIIRQSFSLDIIAEQIKKDGFKIVLSGDLADELFAGYNEFSQISTICINQACKALVEDMDRGHNKRVDRLSMKHTLELRCPFFDTDLVEYAMKLNGNLKIKYKNEKLTTKYILRKVANKYLPKKIAFRYKAPFSNGAGMDVGEDYKKQDGEVAKQILNKYSQIKTNNTNLNKYNFITEEEKIYFNIFKKLNYTKLEKNELRIITKEDLEKVEKKCIENLTLKLKLFFSKKKLFRSSISNHETLETITKNILKENNTLKITGFWGASNKNHISKEDLNTIKNFQNLCKEIKTEFNLKIESTFILSDTHASLNGYLKKNYSKYLSSIELILKKNNFKVIYLSQLWKKYSITHESILEEIKKNFLLKKSTINKIIEASAKNLGFKNYKYEAKRYHIVREIEKEILKKEFPNHIFHTFIKKELSILYPKNLPLIHLWSEKRGISAPPWFEN